MEEKLRSPDNAIAVNLNRVKGKQSDLLELRSIELSELADRALYEVTELNIPDMGVYETLSLILENIYAIGDFENSFSAEDKAVLSRHIALGLLKIGFEERDFFDTAWHDATVTYVKNPYADEAYEVFSEELADARVKYSRDFAECTRLLYNKDVSYCLFPLEEKGGTRLPTVAELIYRNDLKINSITPVFGPDNSLDLKYALVSNHFTVPEHNDEDDRYLEIRIPKTDTARLSELLLAAELFGHTVYRVDTQFFAGELSEDMFFSIVFRDNDELFLSLLVYINLFVNEYNLIGMYKNLE